MTAARPWNWEDPQELAATVDLFTEDLARVDKVSLALTAPLLTREHLDQLGVTGIEFAAFKSAHPQALGTDLVSLTDATGARTGPGHVYRVDDSAYFAEMDIAQSLPVADDTVDWVFAEHLIEHVSLRVGIAWLTEVRRILRPGGLLRLTTPDLKVYAQSYVNGDGFFAKHRRRMNRALTGVAPAMPARGAFMFNQLFYVYGHRWLYDLEELRHALTTAGFDESGITVRAYREGARQDVADLDQVLRNDESIYVEATA
ncbi:class I SAM-dependent methyltransferase [Dactylosporangium fulvum]|uniref:Class I SAM-dependent methyltransferase n=1 Tax=Dactylosporangium fulvum TaxID=53359 RepID=A0ABY5W517_9ACTN|nr:class I SAM-dependent methyltransferase [Dactylosporangium fulvum]UWP85007.1 class I SAM-dependent methyltransferase [Dactylosporangium fulvum]